jgi:hypothetical protein
MFNWRDIMDTTLELLLAQEEGDTERVTYLTALLRKQEKEEYVAVRQREYNMRKYGEHPAPPRDMR